ncbi:MAG: universal stress protein [Ardenticatenaceae bacterium]|nr:universal stress protein [Ardenticatenaceae bacterium]MCB9446436.1 universal stress protein [Ardenticatenaceae bacterium]
MSCIVCATRGGEGSRAVQLAAIERAKQSGQDLVFLFVADSNMQDRVDETLQTAVRDELIWMGNVMLQIAKLRAGAQNIDVRLVVKVGEVREEIAQFLRNSKAELLLLGAPRGTSATVFGDDAIEQFAHAIQEETNVTVEVIRPEEVTRSRHTSRLISYS